MLNDRIILVCTIIGAVVTLMTAAYTAIDRRRKATQQIADETRRNAEQAFQRGRSSRDDEVRLILSERDSARSEVAWLREQLQAQVLTPRRPTPGGP